MSDAGTTQLPYSMSIGRSIYRPAQDFVRYASARPYDIVTKALGQWPSRPNPQAGIREALWLRQHRDEVADDEQPWVAILRNEVVKRGPTFNDVYAELKIRGIRDALVAYVRPREGPRPYRIA